MSYLGKTMRALVVGAFALGAMATASIAQDKPSIISFNGPAGEAYIGRFIKGIKDTAELKGFDIQVFENQFNQAEQDQQVQQVLAAGILPDVFIWWPSDAVAGLGSLRSLARTGVPVLKINQLPNEQVGNTGTCQSDGFQDRCIDHPALYPGLHSDPDGQAGQHDGNDQGQ